MSRRRGVESWASPTSIVGNGPRYRLLHLKKVVDWRGPVWSRNGKELFFWSGEQIWVASYAVLGNSFRAEKPRAWSPGRVPPRAGSAVFAPHPDGKRFAVLKAAEETEVRQVKVVFITNFFDELRRIAPPAKR